MCKLQLMITNKPSTKKAGSFVEMLRNGSKYNGDATGVAVWHGGNLTIDKEKGEASKLLEKSPELWDLFAGSHCMLGHNRLATNGDVENNHNNHPHTIGDWVLIHNGVLRISEAGEAAVASVVKKLKVKQSDCDSWELLANFVHYFKAPKKKADYDERVRQALERALENFNGNFSVYLSNIKRDEIYYVKESVKSMTFRLNVCDDDIMFFGSSDGDDIPNVSYNYKSCGLFWKSEDIAEMDEYVMEAYSNRVYKIQQNIKDAKDILKEVGDIKWENASITPPVKSSGSHRFGRATAEWSPSRACSRKTNYRSQVGTFFKEYKLVAVKRKHFEDAYPEIYDVLSKMGIEWSRLYFENVSMFTVDFSGFSNSDVKGFSAFMEKKEFITEKANAKNNKMVGFCGYTDVGSADDDEETFRDFTGANQMYSESNKYKEALLNHLEEGDVING